MSLDRCINCEAIVDTDLDGDCYFLNDGPSECHCAKCREASE